jgi:glucose-1-phosphate adenylyltransferase
MGATRFVGVNEGGGGRIPVGIGRDCHIRQAIIDLDAQVGDGVKLLNRDSVEEAEEDNYSIRGGIIVVPRGAVIPDGTEI